MADKHPYVSGNGILIQVLDHLKKSFPATLDAEVLRKLGFKLMMAVFSETSPLLKLNLCVTASEKDEQKGFQFLFAGSMMAVRNPRGHEYAVHDSPDECLDHMALASLLLRRLQAAGHKIPAK